MVDFTFQKTLTCGEPVKCLIFLGIAQGTSTVTILKLSTLLLRGVRAFSHQVQEAHLWGLSIVFT